MDTANFSQQRRTIPGLQGLIVRLFDVMLVAETVAKAFVRSGTC